LFCAHTWMEDCIYCMWAASHKMFQNNGSQHVGGVKTIKTNENNHKTSQINGVHKTQADPAAPDVCFFARPYVLFYYKCIFLTAEIQSADIISTTKRWSHVTMQPWRKRKCFSICFGPPAHTHTHTHTLTHTHTHTKCRHIW